jgi:hypothetical protein
VTFLIDDHSKSYCSFNTALFRKRRVRRVDFLDKIGGLHIGADSDSLRHLSAGT